MLCEEFYRSLSRWEPLAIILGIAVLLGACQVTSPAKPTVPAVATLRVGNETFRVLLPTEGQVNAAVAAMRGSTARIPSGRLVPGAHLNAGYSWHLEDVRFAEATLQTCDGRPSDVERAGLGFGRGRFCPWDAEVVAVQPWR